MKKIILITGVAGMVGSNLLKKKINVSNKIIIGIDNFVLGKEKFIKDSLKIKNFFFYKNDLGKKIKSKKLSDILKKNYLSEVWLLAANSDISKGISNSYLDFKNTYLTTYNTMEFIKKYLKKKTKIFFTSSSAVYGNINKTISENSGPLLPISNYGSMKLASEAYLSTFSYLNKSNIFIFRFPNVVGKNLTHGIIFDMKKKILSKKKFIQVLGDGNQIKPYSHVIEILKCMVFISKVSHKNKLNIFNIGTDDKGMKVRNIVAKMVKKYRSKKKIKYQKQKIGWKGDVPKYNYSTKRIKKLGFVFTLSSQDSVLKAIEENF